MKDQFSQQAKGYAKYRPVYPPGLFEFILNRVTQRGSAWDCGTGNGQTALVLAEHFKEVYATDISEKQLAEAGTKANIFYSIQPSERTGFPGNSFDLITVSQALHWFHFDEFYEEVNRVGRPGAWIAVWSYALPSISSPIDGLIRRHHFESLGSYWEPERKWVDENYASIPFPFREINSPLFSITALWTREELEGYLNTWSALQQFISRHSFNPVDDLMLAINRYWEGNTMRINFPLHLRMGQLNK